ncbi:hypothetical protein PGTUg99_009305 [Puccinia graminis f. sp. tritici]|nr:hypothetical protein PGTUg99_009305 [Puccinia graminis f. sp. tritici]
MPLPQRQRFGDVHRRLPASRRSSVTSQTLRRSISATPIPRNVSTTRNQPRRRPWDLMPVIGMGAVYRSENNTEAYLLGRFPGYFPFNVGSLKDACDSCGALHWKLERTLNDLSKDTASYSTCCGKGSVEMPVRYEEADYPWFMRKLLTDLDQTSLEFQRQICAYNNSLSFASCGAEIN